MKNIVINIVLLMLLSTSGLKAQSINWRSFKETQNHLVNLNMGLDNGVIVGVGYGYKLRIERPIVLNMEYSFPFGKNLVDDFKTKLGGQVEAARIKNFSATIRAYSIFRRYQTDYVRLVNFGTEFSVAAGYYKPKWYAAGEVGFDKAITTHIKHGAVMKANYMDIQDGWYVPTGGNFFYGIQSGISFKRNDGYIKVGKTVVQDFKTTAQIPFYFQLGFNRKM